MSRQSTDELKDGFIWNGFDYNLQVWVREGVVQNVGNRPDLVGQAVCTVAGAEQREAA